MNEIVPVVSVSATPDFSGIRFTRSKTGHVQSPWWSYDWKKYDPGCKSPYTMGSRFHQIREMSMFAFAQALGLRQDDIICHQRENKVSGELEWNCGTIFPCPLPVPKLDQAARMREIERIVKQVEPPAIDI